MKCRAVAHTNWMRQNVIDIVFSWVGCFVFSLTLSEEIEIRATEHWKERELKRKKRATTSKKQYTYFFFSVPLASSKSSYKHLFFGMLLIPSCIFLYLSLLHLNIAGNGKKSGCSRHKVNLNVCIWDLKYNRKTWMGFKARPFVE